MEKECDIIVIGAGLTGLTLAFLLKKRGKKVVVIEKSNRTGGAISTHSRDGYIFEEGPSSASLSTPEAAVLFEMLDGKVEMQRASSAANRRMILKNGVIEELPSGIIGGVATNLFTLKDKFRLLFEPVRKKGNNPNETIASLVRRRMGSSFLDYAAAPFIGGIYAGDTEKLVVRHAMPKLYNLEQNYGSFVRGGVAKSFEKKSDYDKKATKELFSARGGFGNLIKALEDKVGKESIMLGENCEVEKGENGFWRVKTNEFTITCKNIVSTVGSYALADIFSFMSDNFKEVAKKLNYAKVVQACVGINSDRLIPKPAFGMLVPPREKRDILGVLYPSIYFDGRAPKGKTLFSIFLGGVNRSDIIEMSSDQIRAIVVRELTSLYNLDSEKIEFIEIFRHIRAIAQYEAICDELLSEIKKFESENVGIILSGSMRDGIGVASRISQAFRISESLRRVLII
ncbi:MAG: protoporphyrinogen oxidase [Rikenellaceae bacterium]